MKPSDTTRARHWLLLIALLSVGVSVLLLNHEPATLIDSLRRTVGDSPRMAWLVFALLALVSQLLIVPSGSLLLMAGGFLLGALPAALIYAALQILTTLPVIRVGRQGGIAHAERQLELRSPLLAELANALKATPFSLSLVLRLTPVIPSAIACLLSVAFSIPPAVFLLATTAVCWVRPLFFASIGAAVPTLGQLADPAALLDPKTLWPLLLALVAALTLLLSRLWVNYRMHRTLANRRESPDS